MIKSIFTLTNLFTASPYGKTIRRRWNNEERNTVMKLFGKYIKSSHLPSTQDILIAIKTHKCLRERTAPQIRTWLHNQRKLEQQKGNFLKTSTSYEDSSCEDSNNEEDSQQPLILKAIRSIFKQHIGKKHTPTVEECLHARKQYKCLSNSSLKDIQLAVFNLTRN